LRWPLPSEVVCRRAIPLRDNHPRPNFGGQNSGLAYSSRPRPAGLTRRGDRCRCERRDAGCSSDSARPVCSRTWAGDLRLRKVGVRGQLVSHTVTLTACKTAPFAFSGAVNLAAAGFQPAPRRSTNFSGFLRGGGSTSRLKGGCRHDCLPHFAPQPKTCDAAPRTPSVSANRCPQANTEDFAS